MSNSRAGTKKKQKTDSTAGKAGTKKRRKRNRNVERRFIRIDKIIRIDDDHCEGKIDDVGYNEMVNKDGTTNVFYCHAYQGRGYHYYLYHRDLNCLEPISQYNSFTRHHDSFCDQEAMGIKMERLVMKDLKFNDESLISLYEDEIVNADKRFKKKTKRLKKYTLKITKSSQEEHILGMKESHGNHTCRFVRPSLNLEEQYDEIKMDELIQQDTGKTKILTYQDNDGSVYFFLRHGGYEYEPICRWISKDFLLTKLNINRSGQNKYDAQELESGHVRMKRMPNKKLTQLKFDEIPPSQGWRSSKEFKKYQAQKSKETAENSAVSLITVPPASDDSMILNQEPKRRPASISLTCATSFGLFPQSRKRKPDQLTPSPSYPVDEEESMEEENMKRVEENDIPDAPKYSLFHVKRSNSQVLQTTGTFPCPQRQQPMRKAKEKRLISSTTTAYTKLQNNK